MQTFGSALAVCITQLRGRNIGMQERTIEHVTTTRQALVVLWQYSGSLHSTVALSALQKLFLEVRRLWL